MDRKKYLLTYLLTYLPYSQTLRLNRICSEGVFFDRRCNELEQWCEG